MFNLAPPVDVLTDLLFEVALPRLKRVLFGDRYGISPKVGWTGGGAFQVVELEGYADALP